MKRSIAVVLTVVIFAAIAVCFLRPAEPYYSVSWGRLTVVGRALPDEVWVEPGREFLPVGDSDLIQLEVRPSTTNGMETLEFRAKSLDENRSFIFDPEIWRNGSRLPDGYIEDKRTGEQFGFGGKVVTRIARHHGAYGSVASPGETCEFYQHIPSGFRGSGDYRVTLYFYDFDPETRTLLSDQPHEISFDMRHKATDSGLSTYGAWWEHETWDDPWTQKIYGDSTVCVRLLLWAEDGLLPRIDHNALKLECRKDDEWRDCTDTICEATGGGISGSCIYGVRFSDATPGDYRLTLVLCENLDGSGEQYTLTLKLRFDE